VATADSKAFSLYLLRCADGSLYTGIATDVARRLREHADARRGARYLRGRAPYQLVFACEVGDRSAASRIEHCIKRLGKAEKEQLVSKPARFRARIRRFLADSSHHGRRSPDDRALTK